ncbi:hypothetical protein EYF80_009170 [Liparis tanakae]|uniref:Uncharacterized protein n=1 Tax=Liparis tanakae TaxID=230148 RepID=A0A4Z2ITN1_9TELE|nr:hypothetical protein EYF80_009170 [Liparis tanakae]
MLSISVSVIAPAALLSSESPAPPPPPAKRSQAATPTTRRSEAYGVGKGEQRGQRNQDEKTMTPHVLQAAEHLGSDLLAVQGETCQRAGFSAVTALPQCVYFILKLAQSSLARVPGGRTRLNLCVSRRGSRTVLNVTGFGCKLQDTQSLSDTVVNQTEFGRAHRLQGGVVAVVTLDELKEDRGVVSVEQGLHQGLDAGLVHLLLVLRRSKHVVEGEDSVGAEHHLCGSRHHPHTHLVVVEDFFRKQGTDTERHPDADLGHDGENVFTPRLLRCEMIVNKLT